METSAIVISVRIISIYIYHFCLSCLYHGIKIKNLVVGLD